MSRRSARLLGCVLVAAALVALAAPLLQAAEEGHGGEKPRLIEPLLPPFAWSALTFLLVLGILWKTAWGPLLRALDERERRIRESLEAADRAREEGRKLQQEHEQLMAEARREASAIVEEGKRDAQVVRDGIVTDARRDAEAIANRAKAEIERAKDSAVHELHHRAVDLSMEIAEKVIQRSLAPDDHRALVQETIERYERMN